MSIPSSIRAPKQRELTEDETIQTFESWRSIITYNLKLDKAFRRFLKKDAKWDPINHENNDETRGFRNEEAPIPEEDRLTGADQAALLELFLEQIANFAPVVNRYFIIENSTCLEDVWQMLRDHYGFRVSGGFFIDLAYITYDPNERHEKLYQRIYALVRDSMLKAGSEVTHHGKTITKSESITPTVENFIVLTWLKLIHPGLPGVVRERYGTDLRTKTLASLKTEISQSMQALLSQIKSEDQPRTYRVEDDIKTLRIGQRRPQGGQQRFQRGGAGRRQLRADQCPICSQVGRPRADHYLKDCQFLPEGDKRYITGGSTRAIEIEEVYEDGDYDETPGIYSIQDAEPEVATVRRVSVKASPHLRAFHGRHTVSICLDSGAESSIIRESEATRLGLKIHPNHNQRPSQAEGGGFMNIIGEVFTTFTWKRSTLKLEALVSRDLASPIIAGVPFLETNGIDILFRSKAIAMPDGSTIPFSTEKGPSASMIRTVNVHLVRSPAIRQTIWPGEFIDVKLPDMVADSDSVLVEPRYHTKSRMELAFQPAIQPVVAGHIRMVNTSDLPAIVSKEDHIFNVTAPVATQDPQELSETGVTPAPQPDGLANSALVKIDPQGDLLTQEERDQFRRINAKYCEVFSSDYPGYNGAAGKFEAIVNMGPTQPPQRKGRMPQYSRDLLSTLQDKLDEMESRGVLATPQKAGVVVENLNPAFLVRKADGDYRTVTAFLEVAKYCKPQPALLPDVDMVLRQVAQWTFIIITDLKSAYFQIPLSRLSQKYCGISTPFKGTRVYQRCAMGMPGSETALEELMSRVLGHLIQEGCVAKLADDLYIGGNSIPELLNNWERTIERLHTCTLRLSPGKTVICPAKAKLLGWNWESGRISANPHTVNVLSSCDPPQTVKALRSFIGSYKALAKVIPNSSTQLGSLDTVVGKGKPGDRIVWSPELMSHFRQAQEALRGSKTITLPVPSDELWIVTDAASRPTGIGATLYVKREDKVSVGGYFSCKLKENQRKWLPCELEALALASAVKHFHPYLIQSVKRKYAATDSKPCVDAARKLEKGEFSLSPRVTSFLSHIGRYPITVVHIKGALNIPADYASRNPVGCPDRSCQICQFVDQIAEEPVIGAIQTASAPTYANRPAWKVIQASCGTLRRVYAHLTQGTRPSKKEKSIRDVKGFLAETTIAPDGLLVVKSPNLYTDIRDRVVVPRSVLHGILTALHQKLDHPSQHQLKTVFNRSYYTLGLDPAVSKVTQACSICEATKSLQKVPLQYTTDPTPPELLRTYAADIMKRARQNILVVRECTSSFTLTSLLPDESARSIKAGLAATLLPLHLQDGPHVIVRSDPAPGFRSLSNDKELDDMHITIDVGQPKNINKNPIAERAVQELHACLRKLYPLGGHVTPIELARATALMNSRIRNRGLSSWETIFRRDQYTGKQLSFEDESIIDAKLKEREDNHRPSEKRGGAPVSGCCDPWPVGTLVYLHNDREKTHARPRYMVVSSVDEWTYVVKFTESQLKGRQYKVRHQDCYAVPNQVEYEPLVEENVETDEADNAHLPSSGQDEEPGEGPPPVPEIPQAILPDIDVIAPEPDTDRVGESGKTSPENIDVTRDQVVRDASDVLSGIDATRDQPVRDAIDVPVKKDATRDQSVRDASDVLDTDVTRGQPVREAMGVVTRSRKKLAAASRDKTVPSIEGRRRPPRKVMLPKYLRENYHVDIPLISLIVSVVKGILDNNEGD